MEHSCRWQSKELWCATNFSERYYKYRHMPNVVIPKVPHICGDSRYYITLSIFIDCYYKKSTYQIQSQDTAHHFVPTQIVRLERKSSRHVRSKDQGSRHHWRQRCRYAHIVLLITSQLTSTALAVFSKSYCPYCKATKTLLSDMGAKYYAIELDQVGTSTMELTQDTILAD